MGRKPANAAWIAGAWIFVLALLYAGEHGSRKARLQAKVENIIELRGELWRTLNESSGISLETKPGTSHDTNTALINALAAKIVTLQSTLSRKVLPGEVRLELALATATLANAQGRHGDALEYLRQVEGVQAEENQRFTFLRERAAAFRGMKEFAKAEESYGIARGLRPKSISATAGLIACQIALGRSAEAAKSGRELAGLLELRAKAARQAGEVDRAIRHLDRAITFQTELMEFSDPQDNARELADSYRDRGETYLLGRNLTAAVKDFQMGIQILQKLPRTELDSSSRLHENLANALLAQGRAAAAIPEYERVLTAIKEAGSGRATNDVANRAAKVHNNLGNALLAIQKVDEAIDQYDAGIKLSAQGARQSDQDLALGYNNRGVCQLVRNQITSALADFNQALGLHTGKERAEAALPFDASVELDVASGFWDKSLEFAPRSWLGESGVRESVVYATALKNRGHVHMVQGRSADALVDFTGAAKAFARLVDEQGELDLAVPFARSLSALAWLLATAPDESIRDGRKALQLARRAGELSGWKLLQPVEAMAAAHAETGSFAEAAEWQEKAARVAVQSQRPELLRRAELYRSGQKYRSNPAQSR